jgi:hypothetical protein
LRGSKEVEIVKVSLEKIPKENDGVIFIATNKKIDVGVEGRDFKTQMDLGGQYVLTKDELFLFIKNSQKLKAVSECKTIEEVKAVLSK